MPLRLKILEGIVCRDAVVFIAQDSIYDNHISIGAKAKVGRIEAVGMQLGVLDKDGVSVFVDGVMTVNAQAAYLIIAAQVLSPLS